ncbi:MAG: preprotein translocase subunit SecG [Chthoniobacterales bacterium]|nr:preprotein translocase subunit SecG [Chthoniobacterales bacterium]
MAILLNILLVIYILVSLLMILVILMQRPKSEGLGAAFGGGVTENIFGAQTTNVLTKITGWLAGTFFFLTFALSVVYAHRSGGSGNLRQELMKTTPASAGAATTPAPLNVAPAVPPTSDESVAPAPTGDQIPAAGPGSTVTAADMAVGAVEPIPAPAAAADMGPSASPGGTP